MTMLAAALTLASCGALRAAHLDHAVVLSAETVTSAISASASGPVAPPDGSGYCRIRGVASPVPGSRIGFEVWLPMQAWNGRFKMVGNGGYSSTIATSALAYGVRSGYAMAATDTGHQGDDPDFAIGLRESIADWGHRAVHETALQAKALIRQAYGTAPRYSYFEGCSTGGHQALMEAQRYPGDFDGIIAGAPGANRTRLNIGFLWQFVANHRRTGDAAPILPAAKLPLLTKAVLATCGSDRERAAGYLDDPFACRFDPAILACRQSDDASCLTAEQVAVAAKMYAGARNPRTGAQLYPPWLPGSESGDGATAAGWNLYWADPRFPDQPARANFFRFWAFHDPIWDWRSFDFDRSVAAIDPAVRQAIDATNPDLSAFRQHGGKLIHYHGLADPVSSPWDSRNYYDAVARRSGPGIDSFYRLFFAPGMAHCGGGPGPNRIAAQPAIEAWVERGEAPSALLARHGDQATALSPYRSDRTR